MYDELYHYGIKGMKWGVRRYENKDGSLTPAGRKRYSDDGDEKTTARKKGLSDKQKKALKVGVAVAGTALAVYGTYKLSKFVQGKQLDKAQRIADDYIAKNSEKLYESVFADGSSIIKGYRNGKMSDYGKMDSNMAQIYRKVNELHNNEVRRTAANLYDKQINSGRLNNAVNTVAATGDTVKNISKRVRENASDIIREEYRRNRYRG